MLRIHGIAQSAPPAPAPPLVPSPPTPPPPSPPSTVVPPPTPPVPESSPIAPPAAFPLAASPEPRHPTARADNSSATGKVATAGRRRSDMHTLDVKKRFTQVTSRRSCGIGRACSSDPIAGG